MSGVKAVVMAGGFGTRIQPLTHSVPKPMLPVVNIPMMERNIVKLKEIGIDDVVILLYYKLDVIKRHFGDGSKWGVNITYVLPDSDYGTAGAVGYAREFLDRTFIVVSGDIVTDFDFKEILKFHSERGAKVTLTLTEVDNPLEFGVVVINSDNVIEKFIEKPRWREVISDTINTGIYVIEPEMLDFIPKNEFFDFARDLFPLLMDKGISLHGYVAEGYWRDVGNPNAYRDVHEDVFEKRVKFEFLGSKIDYPSGELYVNGDVDIGENVDISGVVVLDDGVRIGDKVKLSNVAIGKNTIVGAETKLKNSIVWNNTYIGKKCNIDGAVICNNCRIDDLVEAKSGMVMAEGSKVGRLTKVMQDVTIWPNKEIEPASIITNNIVRGVKYKSSLFEEGIISGGSNTEIDCVMACKIGEAFGGSLPQGCTVVVGRDYESSSVMLKRAFVGGVLASGVNVVDFKSVPLTVLRLYVKNSSALGGVYFRQKIMNPGQSEILIFDENGLRLNVVSERTIEKLCFNESFRHVDYKEVGEIDESEVLKRDAFKLYKGKVRDLIDFRSIRNRNFKVAIDLMYGIIKDIYPDILSELQIDSIILNAYYDRLKMINFSHYYEISKKELSKIITSLGLNLGFIIYPNGRRLTIVGDDGRVLDRTEALFVVLTLLNIEAEKNKKTFKVLLPTWSPDMLDDEFPNIEIRRGKYFDVNEDELKRYDLIATTDGNFSFTEFSLHRDAIYASLKIMEMLSKNDLNLSQIAKTITEFYYKHIKVPCPHDKRTKVIKKFVEVARNKKYSMTEGIKIWEGRDDWFLVIPDNYADFLDVYVQASDSRVGDGILKHYTGLIEGWIKE